MTEENPFLKIVGQTSTFVDIEDFKNQLCIAQLLELDPSTYTPGQCNIIGLELIELEAYEPAIHYLKFTYDYCSALGFSGQVI